jgi:hypothetical protein
MTPEQLADVLAPLLDATAFPYKRSDLVRFAADQLGRRVRPPVATLVARFRDRVLRGRFYVRGSYPPVSWSDYYDRRHSE